MATRVPLQVDGVPIGDYLTELDVLAPAFLVSMLLGIVTSLADSKGRERVKGFNEDLGAR